MVEEGNSVDSIGALGAVDSLSVDHGPAPERAPAARQPSAQEIQTAVNKVNARLSSISRVLELAVDPGSGLTVATIKDSQTGNVLQQFPSTNALHLAEMLADWAGSKSALLDLIA